MQKDSTDFAPSETQKALLSVMQECDYGRSITEACAEAKVGRRTYYGWLESPHFSRWWLQQAERHFARSLPAIYGSIVLSATGKDSSGSIAAARLFLERFDKGFVPRTRKDLSLDMPFGVPEILRRLDGAGEGEG